MDPNATLKELRELLKGSKCWTCAPEMEEIRELFESLDNWLTTGGFRPKDWDYNLKPTTYLPLGSKDR